MSVVMMLTGAIIWALSCAIYCVGSLELPPIHWNSSNTMFKTSNNDHLIEVNMYDEIDFVCPYYDSSTDPNLHEYYAIHRVSRHAYENCLLDDEPLLIVNCSQPWTLHRQTLLIERFSPIPGAPEFVNGESYYFITTSTGFREGINNNYQGACHHNNMKLTIQVCCQASPPSSSSVSPVTPPPSSHYVTSALTTPSTERTTTTSTTTTRTTTTPSTTTTSVKWRSTTPADPATSSTPKSDGSDRDRDNENETVPKNDPHTSSAHRKHIHAHHVLLRTLAGLLLYSVLLSWRRH